MNWQSVSDIVCRQISTSPTSSGTASASSSRAGAWPAELSGAISAEQATQQAAQLKNADGNTGFNVFQQSLNKFTPDETIFQRSSMVSDQKAALVAAALSGEEAGQCIMTCNGQQVDVGAKLLEIAQTDFKKFREILQKLESQDPAEFLAALGEITGIPQADIQQMLRDMDEEQLLQFATDLGSVIGATPGSVLAQLEGIRNMELTARMVDEKLQSMAAEDFWQFYELVRKLQSDDSGDTLTALSELLDLPEEETKRFVELMDPQKLEAIAMALSRASITASSVLRQQLLESTGEETRRWEKEAGLDKATKSMSRNEHILSGLFTGYTLGAYQTGQAANETETKA